MIHIVIDSPYPTAPIASAIKLTDSSGRPSRAMPSARLTDPATIPLMRVIRAGLYLSMLAVMALSIPQHRHAEPTSRAPVTIAVPVVPASVTPPSTTMTMPRPARPPMCSFKKTRATAAVATSSRLSNSDTVPAGVRSRASSSNTGAIPPPSTTATARRDRCEPAGVDRRRMIPNGASASAAPTYNNPASVTEPTSSISSFVTGVAAPNRTAASAHHTHPFICVARRSTIARHYGVRHRTSHNKRIEDDVHNISPTSPTTRPQNRLINHAELWLRL